MITSFALNTNLSIKTLSQWEVSSGDLELTRCKSRVKAICVGLANSANYPDQWSDATIIRCKLHCERVKLFVSLLGGAAHAAVSRDFRSVLHLRCYQRVYGCQSSVFSNSRVYISTSFIFQVSYSYFRTTSILATRQAVIVTGIRKLWQADESLFTCLTRPYVCYPS